MIDELNTLTIGIPAFNEAQTIGPLILSIIGQKQLNYVLKKILVVCDGSSDKTPQIAQRLAKKHGVIQVVNDKKRMGKAARLNSIYARNNSDLLLTLDADLLLSDQTDISKMVTPFLKNKSLGFVGGHQIPVKPNSFVGTILYYNCLLWDAIRFSLPNHDSIHNLFGSVTMMRKNMAQKVRYPKYTTADEVYLYAWAKEQKIPFGFVGSTKVLFQPPKTLRDLQLAQSRGLQERYALVHRFGNQLLAYYHIPWTAKVAGFVKAFSKQPFYTSLALFINLSVRMNQYTDTLNTVGMWETVTTTKQAFHMEHSQ